MHRIATAVHHGIRFEVEAIPCGDAYEGRFTLLDGDRGRSGTDDAFRPAIDNLWATEAEALTYATEAAHHAIDGIQPFVGRGRDGGFMSPGRPHGPQDR